MKATMQSTNKMAIINGMNFRIWEGVSDKGTRFIALVNRLAGADASSQTAVTTELVKDHKDFDPAMAPALATLDPMLAPALPGPEEKQA
jgi:hypothetical protein